DRARIVDAICADGGEILMHRSVGFSNDAVQRCVEAATGPEERRQIVACMRYRPYRRPHDTVTDHVPQNSKALDCEEEVCLLIVSELLWAAPATTLQITELSWTPPAPPIFAYVDKSLEGKWAAPAYHETGSLVSRYAIPLPSSRQDGIIDDLLAHGAAVFGEVAKKSQWGFYCVEHI
ncbi:hypothetical protein B0H14DRAFT_2279472, partial [Mycena olivaceomarginata]